MSKKALRRRILAIIVLIFCGMTTVRLAAAQGPDINPISDDTAGENDTTSPRRNQPEPAIAISPVDPDIIVAGAQDFRRARELRDACGGDRWNGLYVSFDGGETWQNSLVPGFCTDDPADVSNSEMFDFSTNTDPVVVFDPFGHLYYSHIAFNNNPFRTTPPSGSGVLYVSTFQLDSDDEAITHIQTVKVPSGSGLRQAPFEVGPGINSNFDDKQWMAVDNWPGSPHFGRVYVTWTKFGAQGGQSSIWISHCDSSESEACDGFSDGQVVNHPVAGGLVQESFPTVGPDGTVYIAFLQFQGGFGSTRPHSGIWLATSTDGGETFTQQRIARIRQIPSPIPPNSFRTGTVPGVAVTEDGIIHMTWGEWVDNSHAEVRYVHSTDSGWSLPISMNDDPTGHQFFPSIVASGNEVHVAWYDGRENEADERISDLHVFYNRSTNSGETFDSDVQITNDSFDPGEVSRFPVFCNAFIGDYIDIDAVNGKVAIIWNDNREVGEPLSSSECQDFISRPTDPTIQPRLDDGSLDQEAFVDIFEP